MEKKSKSQMKREMLVLQDIGERLVGLSTDQIEKIEMPEELREAVLFAKNITKREALRRQMQFIGVLMRDVDSEPIIKALEGIAQKGNLDVRLFQQVERWRDALVGGEDAPMDDIITRFPDAERTKLHQLVMNARKEREKGKPPSSSRALFRFLMDLAKG